MTKALDAADLRSRLRDLIAPFEAERQSTRVAEIRRELGHKSQELARLLKTVRAAELAMPARPCGRNRLRDARCRSPPPLRTAGGNAATLRPLLAKPHRPAGSRRRRSAAFAPRP